MDFKSFFPSRVSDNEQVRSLGTITADPTPLLYRRQQKMGAHFRSLVGPLSCTKTSESQLPHSDIATVIALKRACRAVPFTEYFAFSSEWEGKWSCYQFLVLCAVSVFK
jgi:hypothetical protein